MGELPQEVGLLPLRNSVLFPGGVLPLTVTRTSTVRLLTDAASRDALVGVVSQRDAFDELPGPRALFDVGVVARVVKLVKHPTHYETVLQGLAPFRTIATLGEVPFIRASIESFASEDPPTEADAEALRRDALELFTRAQMPPQLVELLETFPRPHLASFLATQLGLEVAEQQALLEERSGARLSMHVHTLLKAERARRFWRSEPDGLIEALKAVPVLRVPAEHLTYPGDWVFPPPGREAVVSRGGLYALLPEQGDVGTLVELTNAQLGDTSALMLKGLHRVQLVQSVIDAPVPHARVEVIEADHAMEPGRAHEVLELLLSLTRQARPNSTEAVFASLRALEPGARTDVVAFRYLDVDRAQHLAMVSAAARAEHVLSRAHTRGPTRAAPQLIDIWTKQLSPASAPSELSVVAVSQVMFPGERVVFRATDPEEVALLERLASRSALVGVVSRKTPGGSERRATRANVFDVGTLSRATHFERGAGWYSCVLEGLSRFRLGTTLTAEPVLRVQVEPFVSVADALPEEVASLRADVSAVFALHSQISLELSAALERNTEVERFADAVSGTLAGANLEKQAMLEEAALSRRVRRVHALAATYLAAQLPVGLHERLLAAARGLPLLSSEEAVLPGIGIFPPAERTAFLEAHPLIGVHPAGGTVGTISEVVSHQGERVLKGLARFRLQATICDAPVPRARVEVLLDAPVARELTGELVDRAIEALSKRGATSDARDKVRALEGGALADHLVVALDFSEERRLEVWALTDSTERVKRVLAWLNESTGLVGRLRGWFRSS